MAWDATQYERFGPERDRPFQDLMARVPAADAKTIIDAGCGTGRTTHNLARRYPSAQVVGLDGSADMLAAATPGARVTFRQADLTSADPEPADLVVCNAVLHWIPRPQHMLRRLAGWVAPGGALAIQVPANHDQPSHRLITDLAAEWRWAGPLASVAAGDHVLPLAQYAQILGGAGFVVDAWQTTYLHLLRGPDAVLQWLLGTTLRPVVAALGAAAPAFVA